MQAYTTIEPTIQAEAIAKLDVVTTATLADGTVVTVPNGTVDGDFIIKQTDGSYKVDAAADFNAKYHAA